MRRDRNRAPAFGARGPVGRAVSVGRRVLALELALLGFVLAAAGLLFHHGLSAPASFDEAVYVLATSAMRHGQALGSQIFTAQPPGFYTLIRAGRPCSARLSPAAATR